MSTKLLPDELKSLAPDELLINEFFSSIQGESSWAGQPCFFIRLTGCHIRCSWCDTEYAFFEGERYSVDNCLARARDSGCSLVEVTGGEPLLQKAVYPLMKGLCDQGHEVLLETSGTLSVDRVDPRVRRIVDWKAPGSSVEDHNHPQLLSQLRQGDELKVVLSNRADYEWARDWYQRNANDIGAGIRLWFSPTFATLSARDLAEWVLADKLAVGVNLQLHKMIWDPTARGV